MATKADWKAAKADLDAIERERAAIFAPTKERYEAARERLEIIVDELDCGDFLGTCIGCQEPMFEGDRIHHGDDESLCFECAPTYQEMLEDPQHFVSYATGEPMTEAEAKAAVDAHIAKGGSAGDKMVSA